ncbi:threonine synthase [Candidatus Bipolaricaulota bacterium]|nr:threonine synthase [Candidatus Bipolaricaulota bacterium]
MSRIPTPSSRLVCVRGCRGQFPITDGRYHCPDCGGLLDVEHDLDALRRVTGDEWRTLFRDRAAEATWPYSSGVWSKKEWVLPEIEAENIVSLGEGRTPLLFAERLGQSLGLEDLWVKQSGTSHSGSFKDLGMTALISVVKQRAADGQTVRAVACASSGDTSAALASYGAAAGFPTIVLLPKDRISQAQLAQPLACGAIVLAVDTDFDGCMKIVRDLAEDPSIYLANSMNALRLEGQKTVAVEIVEQLSWEPPDWIILPCGNLGNISAIAKGFVLMRTLGLIDRLPRIAAAQAENANPLYRSYLSGFRDFEPVTAAPTLASAIQIGNPVSYERAVRALAELDGVVVQAGESALSDASARADSCGLYTCPQTGVALAGLTKLLADGTVRRNERVVVIATAHGLKFTPFKMSDPSSAHPFASSRFANRPTEVGFDSSVIQRVIRDRLTRHSNEGPAPGGKPWQRRPPSQADALDNRAPS